MLRRHSEILNNNLTELVDKTDVKKLIPELLAGDVLTQNMLNQILVTSNEDKLLATSIYLACRRRGPHAFSALVKALNNSGHIELGNLLLSADAQQKRSSSDVEELSEDTLDSSPPHVCRIPATAIPYKLPNYIRNLPTDGFDNVDDLVSFNCDGLNDNVVVLHATELMKTDRPPGLYSMTSKPRGYALIINNLSFDDDEEYPLRNGAERDHVAMESLLNQLYFEVESHLNKTRQEMRQLVETFASKPEWKHVDCAWIVFMSHGKEGDSEEDTEIVGTDGFGFKTRDIISYFHNDSCPLLINKPKIFIFQSCRGGLSDQGVEVDLFNNHRAYPPRTETDGRAVPRIIRDRTKSDMFIAHPVPPGIKANRDRFAGAWFIQTIVDVFAQYALYNDVEELFKIVDTKIKNFLNPGNANFQTVTTRCIGFSKKLYFNPGLSFQNGRLVREKNSNDSGMDVVDTPAESQLNGKISDKMRLTEEEDEDVRTTGCFSCKPS